MLNKAQAHKLRALIDRLVAAEVADSWKGGGDPADIPAIEAELQVARNELNTFIDRRTAAHDHRTLK